MDKATFTELLNRISVANRDFAAGCVTNQLPDSFLYFVHLNQSNDKQIKLGEHIFPNDISVYGERVGPIAAPTVVDLLWRDGLIPEWIDISVERSDAEHTYFEILCCGRFTADDALLYYVSRGQGPFGSKSPRLPPSWSKEQGRFDLHWYLKR